MVSKDQLKLAKDCASSQSRCYNSWAAPVAPPVISDDLGKCYWKLLSCFYNARDDITCVCDVRDKPRK